MGSLNKYMPTLDNEAMPQAPLKIESSLSKYMQEGTPVGAEYETVLTSEEEKEFKQWKSVNAPEDSGIDYDYRGAYQQGATPDKSKHWPDTFKKPSHPTFSAESMYAKDAPDLAGKWEGEEYIPSPAKQKEREQRFMQNDPYAQLLNKSILRGHKPLLGHILQDVPRVLKQGADESDPVGAIKVLGQALKRVPDEVRAAFIKMSRGIDGTDALEKGETASLLKKTEADSGLYSRRAAAKYGSKKNILPFVPITIEDVSQLPESIAYSLASMGTGVAIGAPIMAAPIPGARPVAYLAGSAASGKAAFEMSSYSVMQSYLESMNEQSIKEKGREITYKEQDKLREDFKKKAKQYGLWEAVPEAVSNLAFATVIGAPLTKIAGKGVAGKMLTKLGLVYGEELLTETITQKGQAPIEASVGLREIGHLSWSQAFKEVAPQTFLLSTILGGAGTTMVEVKRRLSKSAKAEVGDAMAEELLAKLDAELDAEKPFAEQLDAEAEIYGENIHNIILEQFGDAQAVPGVNVPPQAPQGVTEGILGVAPVVQPEKVSSLDKYMPLGLKKFSHTNTWYHGTKAPITDLSEADPVQFSKISAIFGEGLYLTDNPDVAGSYSKKKGIGPQGKVLSTKVKDVKLLDLEKELPEDVLKVFNSFDDLGIEDFGGIGINVWEDMRFAIDGMMESEVVEIFQELNNQLWELGYRGLKHIGGKLTKSKFGEHNVVVLFQDPYTLKIDALDKIVDEQVPRAEKKTTAQKVLTPKAAVPGVVEPQGGEVAGITKFEKKVPGVSKAKKVLSKPKDNKRATFKVKVDAEWKFAVGSKPTFISPSTSEITKKGGPSYKSINVNDYIQSLQQQLDEVEVTDEVINGENYAVISGIPKANAEVKGKLKNYFTKPDYKKILKDIGSSMPSVGLSVEDVGRSKERKEAQQRLINEHLPAMLAEAKRLGMQFKAYLESLGKYSADQVKYLVGLSGQVHTPIDVEPIAGLDRKNAGEEYKIPGVNAQKKHINQVEKEVKKKLEPTGNPLIKKLVKALKKAKSSRGKQEKMFSKERSERFGKAFSMRKKIGGREGFKVARGVLSGELTKVQFKAIEDAFTQENLVELFDMIGNTKFLIETEKLTAANGLEKILKGSIPTKQEISFLNKVFGQEFTEAIMDKDGAWAKFWRKTHEILNLPRAVMASGDLSGIGRQGILLAARHPGLAFKAFGAQFSYFNNQESFDNLMKTISEHELYDLARRAGLALTDIGAIAGEREEQFRSKIAEMVPLVLRSERAYVGTLNKLRFDSFVRMVEDAKKAGLDPTLDMNMAENIAKLVNTASGRAGLGKFEPIAEELNTFFFSPRLWMGRLQMINPAFYMKLEPFARVEALKTMRNFVGLGLTTMFLGALAGGEVDWDPTSSDFGKIRFGNTRIDVFGGYQQPIRLMAQVILGKTTSSSTGKVTQLGVGYKPKTKADIILQYISYKEAPVFSLLTDYLSSEEEGPKAFELGAELRERFTYMFMQDMYDVIQDDPNHIPLGLLGIFGIGVQTY